MTSTDLKSNGTIKYSLISSDLINGETYDIIKNYSKKWLTAIVENLKGLTILNSINNYKVKLLLITLINEKVK